MSKPPLDGVRVADFCWAWAGPYGALQLAHLGAEVIRIESQTRICPSRMIPPWAENEPGVNRAGYFNQYNQGKRSLALDLKKRLERVSRVQDVDINAAGFFSRERAALST